MADTGLREKSDAFLGAVGLLVRRVRAVSASHGLSLAETTALSRLLRAGPATTAELARAESIKPQSMGMTVVALEQAGLVERRPHPTDGRQVYIRLTAEGEATIRSAKDERRTWVAERIAELDPEERDTLFAASAIIARMVDR